MGTNQRALQAQALSGVWGYPLPENFDKLDCLRQHFMCFEGGLIGNKAAKSEGKTINNASIFF